MTGMPIYIVELIEKEGTITTLQENNSTKLISKASNKINLC